MERQNILQTHIVNMHITLLNSIFAVYKGIEAYFQSILFKISHKYYITANIFDIQHIYVTFSRYLLY